MVTESWVTLTFSDQLDYSSAKWPYLGRHAASDPPAYTPQWSHWGSQREASLRSRMGWGLFVRLQGAPRVVTSMRGEKDLVDSARRGEIGWKDGSCTGGCLQESRPQVMDSVQSAARPRWSGHWVEDFSLVCMTTRSWTLNGLLGLSIKRKALSVVANVLAVYFCSPHTWPSQKSLNIGQYILKFSQHEKT